MIDAVRRALYDGYAEWHDENIAPFGLAATDTIRRLLSRPRAFAGDVAGGRVVPCGAGEAVAAVPVRDLLERSQVLHDAGDRHASRGTLLR